MAHWEDNKLMHNWFGRDKAEYIGELQPNTDKRKVQKFVFTAEVMGERFVRYYYETPPARTVLESFMLWSLNLTDRN